MQSMNRRWAYYYNFHLKMFPIEAPQFLLEEVLPKIKNLSDAGEAIHAYRNNEVIFRIKEIKESNNYWGLLIHVSDLKATDPAFSDVISGKVRVEPKKKTEGIGAACHIIIKKDLINDTPGKHLALIEEVVGVPKSMIEKFLTHILKICCQTSFKKKGSKGKKENTCRPKAVFNGHPSATLEHSLETGTLQGIILLNSNEGAYIDDNKELQTSTKVVKIKATNSPTGNIAYDLIQKARKYAIKERFDEIKIQYSEIVGEEHRKDKNGKLTVRDIKKQRTLPISIRNKNTDLSELLFVKSELIELETEIGQCEENMHKDLLNKMTELLKKIS